jgi:hypothetical protein
MPDSSMSFVMRKNIRGLMLVSKFREKSLQQSKAFKNRRYRQHMQSRLKCIIVKAVFGNESDRAAPQISIMKFTGKKLGDEERTDRRLGAAHRDDPL